MNNKLVLEQAQATARLVLKKNSKQPAAQIRAVYLRALSRPPSKKESALGVRYLKMAQGKLGKKQKNVQKRDEIALASFVQMVFGSAEFRYLIQPANTRKQSTSSRKLTLK